MGYGYSQNLVRANKQASARSLGVALGRVCIRRGISVIQIAEHFGVSRMTVYNWFKGVNNPRPDLIAPVQRYIKNAL
jgi:transposase